MRKLLVLSLAILLVAGVAGSSYAVNSPKGDNIIYIDGNKAPTAPPATEVRLVRYARGCKGGSEANYGGLSSGDVVAYDVTSHDGITISGCVVVAGTPRVPCGVLVTDIATTDSTELALNTSNGAGATNWGYMAVRGYVLAKVDSSQATTGGSLRAVGPAEAAGSEKTFGTADISSVGNDIVMSTDCGVLLYDTTSDGLMPCVINLP